MDCNNWLFLFLLIVRNKISKVLFCQLGKTNNFFACLWKKYKEKVIADILETIFDNMLHLLSVKMKMLLRWIFSHPMRLCHYLVQGKRITIVISWTGMSHFNWFKHGTWLQDIYFLVTWWEFIIIYSTIWPTLLVSYPYNSEYLIQKLHSYKFLLIGVIALWNDY